MTEQSQQSSLLGKIAAYTEILAKDPRSTIFVSLSEAYRKMGMLDDARQVIERGLETHRDFSPAYIVLGRILCQLGEYTGSESSFQKALEFDPTSLAAFVGYARLCILLGHEEKAREQLLKAREQSPADPVINKLLLSLPEPVPEEPVEEEPVPVEMTEEVAEPSPLASATLADLYMQQGLLQQALEVYRQLSIDEPDNLLFRRKIRDLEEDLSGLVEGQEPQAPDVSSEEQMVASDDEVLTDPEISPEAVAEPQDARGSVTEHIEPLEVSNQVVGQDKILATLNRWLDSIQQRREDV